MQTTDTARQTKTLLTEASRDHSTALTVYGRVVQTMQLPGLEEPWEFVEPKSYLRYMSTLSDSYAEVMNSTQGPTKFTVILYLDNMSWKSVSSGQSEKTMVDVLGLPRVACMAPLQVRFLACARPDKK